MRKPERLKLKNDKFITLIFFLQYVYDSSKQENMAGEKKRRIEREGDGKARANDCAMTLMKALNPQWTL